VTDPLPLGTYTATLKVLNNDPVAGTQEVVVLMHVVEEYITPTASFESNSPVCLGETAVFTNTTIPGVPPQNAEGQAFETTYLWDFGDGETSTEFEPTHVYTEPGTYDVSLEACNMAGMCDTYADTVEVLPLPVSGFGYEVAGFEVSFTNTSLDALSYEWDFGDGMGSTDENPVHTYAAANTYTVILTATNDCAIDVYSAEVEVIGLYYYYLPLIHKNYE
jgi:PKD repeat protein